MTNLQASTLYHYRVKSRDAAGNLLVSQDLTFTTPAAADVAAPLLVGGVQTTNLTSTSATINWVTNEASDTQVEFGPTTAYGGSSPLNGALSTNHSVALTDLQASTLYHYRVKSRDAAGNLLVSQDLTFTTPAADVTPPIIFSVGHTNLRDKEVTIHWSTDQMSDGQVEYGVSTSLGSQTPLNGTFLFGHSAKLSNLQPGTWYLFRVKSRDSAGNLATSELFSFQTLVNPPAAVVPDTPSLRIVPEGFTEADQYVIPQYANGGTGPAGQIIGWGIDSILAGSVDTPNQPTKAVVVTEGWTDPNATVTRALVRDVAILGYDDSNPYDEAIYGTSGSVSSYQLQYGPYEYAADLYHGRSLRQWRGDRQCPPLLCAWHCARNQGDDCIDDAARKCTCESHSRHLRKARVPRDAHQWRRQCD